MLRGSHKEAHQLQAAAGPGVSHRAEQPFEAKACWHQGVQTCNQKHAISRLSDIGGRQARSQLPGGMHSRATRFSRAAAHAKAPRLSTRIHSHGSSPRWHHTEA